MWANHFFFPFSFFPLPFFSLPYPSLLSSFSSFSFSSSFFSLSSFFLFWGQTSLLRGNPDLTLERSTLSGSKSRPPIAKQGISPLCSLAHGLYFLIYSPVDGHVSLSSVFTCYVCGAVKSSYMSPGEHKATFLLFFDAGREWLSSVEVGATSAQVWEGSAWEPLPLVITLCSQYQTHLHS